MANLLAHAMAGCAVGAARPDGNCGAGALGAAIGELAASLYDPGALNTQGNTVQFATLISSLAAGVAGLDANEINQAGQAGGNAAANNWLATQQQAQMRKELAAATSWVEQLKVLGKWAGTSVKQDALTATGVGLGLAEAGINDIQGMAEFLADPVQGLDGVKQLISSPEAREQFGDSVFRELDAKIDRMQLALAEGGDQNALQLGKDLGGLIYQVGSVVGGAAAATKVGVAVVESATTLGVKALESAAVKTASLAQVQNALSQQIADLRAALPSRLQTSGNMGLAQINIPGVQPTMAASSRIGTPTAEQVALGFVGEVSETFPSSVVPTASNPPLMLNRAVDSEAKILNNIAAQLGDNTSASGTINLLTERAPCASCSNVIQQFQAKYPNIEINVMDNGGVISPNK